MADQFNKQQLLLAREVAINIETFLDQVSNDIASYRSAEVDRINRVLRTRAMAEAMSVHMQSELLVTIGS